jgi:hypothetical protein
MDIALFGASNTNSNADTMTWVDAAPFSSSGRKREMWFFWTKIHDGDIAYLDNIGLRTKLVLHVRLLNVY